MMFGNNDSVESSLVSSSLGISSNYVVSNSSNNSTSEVLSSANNHETFLKLDIESLLTDLHQQDKQQQNQQIHQKQLEIVASSSHNSKNGSMNQLSPQEQFVENSLLACGGSIGSRRIDEPFEYTNDDSKISEDSDSKMQHQKIGGLENFHESKRKEVGLDCFSPTVRIVSNSLSSATVCQPPIIRNVSNTSQQQQQKMFTIVQYDPQQQSNNSISSPLTYHHISPSSSNQFPILSNTVSTERKSKKSKDNFGKSKRERTTLPPSLESQLFQTNSIPSTSTFQWSENEFQEFTSGQHETQKRQRKERVYKFYDSGPTSFNSNSEDPQSATSLISNNSIFDSNSPNSPPMKKKKRKKKQSSTTAASSSTTQNPTIE